MGTFQINVFGFEKHLYSYCTLNLTRFTIKFRLTTRFNRKLLTLIQNILYFQLLHYALKAVKKTSVMASIDLMSTGITEEG